MHEPRDIPNGSFFYPSVQARLDGYDAYAPPNLAAYLDGRKLRAGQVSDWAGARCVSARFTRRLPLLLEGRGNVLLLKEQQIREQKLLNESVHGMTSLIAEKL